MIEAPASDVLAELSTRPLETRKKRLLKAASAVGIAVGLAVVIHSGPVSEAIAHYSEGTAESGAHPFIGWGFAVAGMEAAGRNASWRKKALFVGASVLAGNFGIEILQAVYYHDRPNFLDSGQEIDTTRDALSAVAVAPVVAAQYNWSLISNPAKSLLHRT